MFRVFVGTMHAGENEFEKCMQSINSQKEVDVHHLVIEGMREYEAHEKLYSIWESRKNEFDAFIKVDADMVLKDDKVLHNCVRDLQIAMKVGYTSIQFPLYDSYLEDMIYGLNCYSTSVSFPKPESKIYCDRTQKNNVTKVVRSQEDTSFELFPAGTHCENPGDYQAFMWGYHRGSKNHLQVLEKVRKAFNRKPSRKKVIALAGFKAGHKLSRELSYGDAEFLEVYSKYTAEDDHFLSLARGLA